MAILTEADKAVYFPSVTLAGDALDGAIALTQSLIEAAVGRPLELTAFHENKAVNAATQTVQLSYVPVALDPAPVLRTRLDPALNRYRRPINAGEWSDPLSEGDYELDAVTGYLRLSGAAALHIQADYTAGLNFSLSTPPILALKAAAGSALTYSLSDAFKGVSSRRVDGEYTVSYSSQSGGSSGGGAIAGGLPPYLILPFMKYRPRHW